MRVISSVRPYSFSPEFLCARKQQWPPETVYINMHTNMEYDVIAACGQQLMCLNGFRNPRAPLPDVFAEYLAK